MLRIELPGVGDYTLAHLASDFTGTLSVDGKLLPGVAEAMDKVAAVGVAVIEAEGCAVEAIGAADIVVRTILDAFALITNPDRIRATLRG